MFEVFLAILISNLIQDYDLCLNDSENLYLKANKGFFGFKELQFVGKVLSEGGLKVFRTKIQNSNFRYPLLANS